MFINIFLTTTKSKEKASGINAKGYLFRKDFLKLVTLGIMLKICLFLIRKDLFHLLVGVVIPLLNQLCIILSHRSDLFLHALMKHRRELFSGHVLILFFCHWLKNADLNRIDMIMEPLIEDSVRVAKTDRNNRQSSSCRYFESSGMERKKRKIRSLASCSFRINQNGEIFVRFQFFVDIDKSLQFFSRISSVEEETIDALYDIADERHLSDFFLGDDSRRFVDQSIKENRVDQRAMVSDKERLAFRNVFLSFDDKADAKAAIAKLLAVMMKLFDSFIQRMFVAVLLVSLQSAVSVKNRHTGRGD